MSQMTITKIPAEKAYKKSREKTIFIVMSVALAIYSIAIIMLVFWGFITSVKSNADFRTNKMWLPSGAFWTWQWGNFLTVLRVFSVQVSAGGELKTISMLSMLRNTVLYAGVGSVIAATVPMLVAYAVAKFDYKFSKLLLAIVLIAMILPIVGSAPSELALLRRFGMYDTLWGNWLQRVHFLGMYFLVYHASFKNISKELSEAAYVDGAGEFRVMFRIILPLVRTVFFTVMLIKFVEFWNDYQTPLIYLPSYPTLANGVFFMSNISSSIMGTVPMRMAAVMILLIPVLTIFIAFRKKLMGNLTMGGVKE